MPTNQNKSCKILFLSFALIVSTTNYKYAKFYEVLTILLQVIVISISLEVYISASNIYML